MLNQKAKMCSQHHGEITKGNRSQFERTGEIWDNLRFKIKDKNTIF